uniref:BRCT domain-containing protein n=1 Tax=Parascaris equorum TaxID=6256 RepID=A0A914RAA0_PAREQ
MGCHSWKMVRFVRSLLLVSFRLPLSPKANSVPWEKLMLRANQASELLTAKVNTACDVIADGDIFRGISVVVTSAMRKNKNEEQAFSKREVRQMIESHGGIVSDDFTVSTFSFLR